MFFEIDFGDMTQRGTPQGDLDQATLFSQEWNKRYPDCPSIIKPELRDHGEFDGIVQISFDKKTFENIEEDAGNLAVELNLDFQFP